MDSESTPAVSETEEETPSTVKQPGGLAIPLFVLSLAILAQEILLTRLLAVGLWHHITYMVVTSALLAFGFAGTLLAIFPGLAGTRDGSVRSRFALYALLFALTSFVSTHAIGSANIDTNDIFTSRTTFSDLFSGVINELFLLYVLVGLPIFFGGLAVATALRGAGKRVPRLYFANLLGSAAGCGLFLVALAPLGGPNTMLLTIVLGCVAAMLTPTANRLLRLILPGVVAATCLVGMAAEPVREILFPSPEPVPSKTINDDLEKTGGAIEKTIWTTLCRLDVVDSETPAGDQVFDRKIVHQDGDAPTFLEPPTHPAATETTVPYVVHPNLQSICIIGSGGSRELRLAQNNGVKRAVGVEINGGTVSLVKEHYSDFVGDVAQPHVAFTKRHFKPWLDSLSEAEKPAAEKAWNRFLDTMRGVVRVPEAAERANELLDGFAKDLAPAPAARGGLSALRESFGTGLAGLPDVELVNAEGRSYLARTDETFDWIQLTGVDTYAALSSGAYVNSESYLYTSDAFDSYLDHLNPGGYFTIIRYAFPFPRETMRLFMMGAEALKRRGIADPTQHMLVVTVGTWGILVVGKDPIPEERLPAIRQTVAMAAQFSTAERKPRIEYDPHLEVAGSPYVEAMTKWREGQGQAFIDAYPFNIASISDNEPFFYLYHRWDYIIDQLLGKEIAPGAGAVDNPGMTNMGAVPTGLMVLLSMVIQSLALGLFFVLVPLIVFKGRALRLPGRFRSTLYFACLGLAFMLLEIGLAQKFSLFLGHPTLSLGVVLAGCLFFSGIGSLVSGLFPARRIMPIALIMVVVSAVTLVFLLPHLTEMWLQKDDMTRILYAMIVIGPLGFFMGMPMPSGLRILSERGGDLVSWAWGVNGVASVLGSTLAVVLAMSVGFQYVMLIAAGLYAMALLVRIR